MSKLRIGVIGAGHLGRIHAKLIGQVDQAELVAISDPFENVCVNAHEMFQVPTFQDYRDCIDQVDAVVIASPTDTHAEIAETFLCAGKHVFAEKPLTISGNDAHLLTMLARKRNLTLQVGHVERFNPAFTALGDLACDVKYIEAVRASRFPGRCLDVGVVMDLMIHDLDLVLSMTRSPLEQVSASGLAVVSDHEDMAEARLEFECGLVANLKASRVSPAPARSMQVFGSAGFADVDFGSPALSVVRPSATIADRSFDLDMATDNPLGYSDQLFSDQLACETIQLEPRNAILDELHDFVISIQSGVSPTVDGVAGARAVCVAEQIVQSINDRQWYNNASPIETGPHAVIRETIESSSRRNRRAA